MEDNSDNSDKIYKYKIILTKPNNIIASDIYNKINKIISTDRRALVYNTEKYIYNHLLLPFYEKKILKISYINMEYRMLSNILF